MFMDRVLLGMSVESAPDTRTQYVPDVGAVAFLRGIWPLRSSSSMDNPSIRTADESGPNRSAEIRRRGRQTR